MDIFVFFTIFSSITISIVKGGTVDNCPPVDPNCHPSCIEYTAAHCRYCRCTDAFSGSGSSGSGSSWSAGSGSGSGSSSWDSSFGSSDWATAVNSEKDAFSGSSFSGSGFSGGGFSGNEFSGSGGFSNSGGSNTEATKYVIIEKQPEPSYTESIYPDTSILPGPFPGSGGSPFLAPSVMGPGSIPSIPHAPVSSSHSMSMSHGRVIHVPLLAPGVPKYCVRGKILSCPSTCERVDEWGCKSCPCAPARFQTMPVLVGGSQTYTNDCPSTELCARNCKNGYTLGDVGQDGCRKCSCASNHEETSCPETLKCMLKCKDGYFLGDRQANGCPSCRCLSKGSSSHSSDGHTPQNGYHLQGQKNDNSGGSSMWSGNGNGQDNGFGNAWKGDSGSGSNHMTGSGTNDILKSDNGVGSGDKDCKPPMCLDPNMSEKDAMKMGEASANGGINYAGVNGGISLGNGGDKDGCKPPMCFGTGQSMGTLTGDYGGGSSGSSSSCKPFCASGSGMGMGGGMGSGSSTGGSGMPFSPFSSALTGSGPGMSGGSGGFGIATGGSSTSSAGSSAAVAATAYNSNCFGPACSAKNGMQHKNCPGLLHCMVTCDGSYKLGALDSNGCQTCTCS